ncbi:carboxymuconolactone decarboxylase family protein [Acuticoccus sp.]|uniref:carboxymuconolactone decarboxylase family protein n=1 Tax=Acuticoccus sp. TaxID=1904378 RepID=UPI003B52A9C1
MERLPPPDPADLTPPQRSVADTITKGPRGAVIGPLAVWLHKPEFAANAQALGQYCRFETLLPRRLSELAILVTAKVWSSEFEWQAHAPIALEGGLSSEVIEAIRTDAEPPFSGEDERVVAAFARAAQEGRGHISDEVYEDARRVLGEPALVDLVGILGYYCLISMTINVFGVPPQGPRQLT